MAVRSPGDRPIATYVLIAVSVVVFGTQLLLGGVVSAWLRFIPVENVMLAQPWRVVTSMFTHGGLFHLLFNMYALYLFGTQLEHLLGRARFLVLYFLAGIGGSAAVVVLSPDRAVIGASGAIFGLFAAYFVIVRRLGGNATQLLVVIGLNFVIGFVPGFNISWQAHLGGAVVGALVALVLVSTRRRTQQGLQALGLFGIAVVTIAVLVSRFFVSY